MLAVLLTAVAFADDGGGLFQPGLMGIGVPGEVVRGVTGGGLPWVAKGEMELDRSGQLRAEVRGLLLAAGANAGTTGPVTMVSASLTCEGAGVVATTKAFPLNGAGNADIRDTVTAPASCLGPIVLIRAGTTGPWLAATGFQSGMPEDHE